MHGFATGAAPSLRIASSSSFSYRSKHCAAVRPTMGAIVRHCHPLRCHDAVASPTLIIQRVGRLWPVKRKNLSWHNFCQMQQLFVFVSGPFCFLDAWIKPFIPPCFALLSRLARKQTGNTRPLIFSILHHCSFKNLILRILPNAALNHDPHGC